MFDRLKDSLNSFSEKARSTVAERELDEDEVDDLLWDLEMELLQDNVAEPVVERITDDLREELVGMTVTRMKGGNVMHDTLQETITDILQKPTISIADMAEMDEPGLVLFEGFNGSGKTTTIAKVAKRLKDDHRVLLAAGDTFRSAAIDQLQEHGDNLDITVISHEYGADPTAVIYDAREHAEKEGYDIILADTAGRSHSDRNLMDELDKICRVNEPDMKILVVDALAGNDVINQAEEYERIGFDGIIMTKIDVDKKGGSALSLSYVTGKPILFLGTGQEYDDLEPFDPEALATDLLDGLE